THSLLISLRGIQSIELMQLRLQQRLVRQLSLVLGDQCRGQAAVEGVVHHFVILAGTQQHADGRLLMGFADIAIQRFQVEAEFAEIFRLETSYLELNGHQAVEAAMKKQQVQSEIAPTYLQGVLGADKAEVTAKLDQEVPKTGELTLVKVRLNVTIGQVKKFDHVGIAEHLQGRRMSLSQHC